MSTNKDNDLRASLNWQDPTNNVSSDFMDDDLLGEGVWVESINKIKKNVQSLTLKTKILWYLIFFLLFVTIWVYGVYNFFYLTLQPQSSLNKYEKIYLSFVKSNIINLISTVDNSQTIDSYLDLTTPLNKEIRLKHLFSDKSIPFYTKLAMKENLNKQFYSMLDKFLKQRNKYQDLLVKHKYYANELSAIVKEIKLLPIFLSLNAIKIYITDYVFIKSWLFEPKIRSFVRQRSSFAANYTNIPSSEVKNRIVNDLIEFKDLGAYVYLKNIYFNYMYSADDFLANSYFINAFRSKFNDRLLIDYNWFSRYYPYVSKDEFIASYIRLLKSIYDKTISFYNNWESIFMPIDVQLLSYDPVTEQLSFSVRLMLSPDMLSKITPVGLMSDVVTLLRESRLIIWKYIEFKGMKVSQVTKMVGGYKLVYQTIEKRFVSSVQSPINIEVTDQN